MKNKAEISRPLLREILDELNKTRDFCLSQGGIPEANKLQSIIARLCKELAEDLGNND